MSRMAQNRVQYLKETKDKKPEETPSSDTRSVASKLWDQINVADSDRTFKQADATEKGKQKSGKEQFKNIGKSLFSGTEKVGDAVDALTGHTERRSNEMLQKLNKKEITKEEYQKFLDDQIEDTKWAGTEDKGLGDRFKKAAGVAAEATSELVPVGAGSVAAKGAGGASRMARTKLAAKVGAATGAVGAVGGAGGTLADDSVDLSTDEGKKQLVSNTLISGATSALLGAGGTAVPNRPILHDERGSVSIPSWKTGISDDLKAEIKRGNLDPNVGKADVDKLDVGGQSSVGAEIDRPRVDQYKALIQNGDEIDPIIVAKDQDGVERVIDGAHRLTAAKEMGIREIPILRQTNNVLPKSKVEAPTLDSISVKEPVKVSAAKVDGETPSLQLKVLNDVQREADVRSPGDVTIPAKQTKATKTQQGAQYIVDDIDKLQKTTGIDLDPVDRDIAGALTGEVRRSTWQEFKDKMGKNFQDTLTYSTRTLGKPGADFVYNMLQGNKFKRDALDSLRDDMGELAKINKKVSGKSITSRRDVGARIGQALDDRANAQNYLRNEDEKALFDGYVKVFDYVKQLREKAGLETLENYRPWVNMREAAEPPTWLSEGVTTKKVKTQSRFSKERTRDTPSEDVDNNLADMIYGYVNSQLNELAYDAPVRQLKGNLDNLSAGTKANVAEMQDGVAYLRTLVEQAVNPQRKTPVERGAGKLTSNVYGAVLPFNLRLAVQNKTQKFVANSRVSKGARRLVKQMDENDLKDLESGLVFGDSTVYGQLEDVNPTVTGKGKGIREKAKDVDPYQNSEKNNVLTSYNKGVAQAILDSDQYKAAIKSGLSRKEAAKAAIQDPTVREAAIRRGNVIVNDTQFGASPLARPEMLREEGSVWGIIPKKTLYMFSRFPIGMSQHVLETLDNKSTRALELLKNGDPRASSISEMRGNYKALLDSMKDAQVAVKEGRDVGIPAEVLSKQVDTVTKNLNVIDKEIKKMSQIRGGKTVKNLGKMWAAAAAIQIVFDGGLQSFADDPGGTSVEALNKTNPTLGNRVVGSYSPLAGVYSSASPLDRRGGINERAVANYVPGVGLAVNRGRDLKKLSDSLFGSEEEE